MAAGRLAAELRVSPQTLMLGVTDPGVVTLDLLEGNSDALRIGTGRNLGGNIGRRTASRQRIFDWVFEPYDPAARRRRARRST